MSKIQKALDAIRKTPSSADGKPSQAVVRSRSPELPESALRDGDEIVPRRSLEIDIDALIETGLLPDGESADLISEQFRRIKRPVLQIAFDEDFPVDADGHSNIIMMVSAMPGAGKSFCAFNLAQSIALERDFGSILVDADVLKPGLSRALGLQDEPGLTDYLIDPSIDIADVLVATDLHNTVVLPAGYKHPEATELLASRRMRNLASTLSERFANRAVIVDTPPLLLTNEAQVLAGLAGQLVFVIEARKSSQDSVVRAVSLLDRSKPVNAILNKSRSASGSGYHSDDYGYYQSIGTNITGARDG